MSAVSIDKIINSPDLPSLPVVAIKLVEASRNPNIEIKDVHDIIKSDPAITGKIVKSANSSYFGFSSKCSSLERAISLLGMKISTSLALSFSLADDSFNNNSLKQAYDEYWLQSILQASCCEKLGAMLQQKNLGDYFLAGLVVDIGRLAMLKTISREYYTVLTAVNAQQKCLHDVEKSQLGFDHAQISSQMIAIWNFPEEFIDAINLHNQPAERILEIYQGPGNELQKSIITAAYIGEYFCAKDNTYAHQVLKVLLKEFFNVQEDGIEEVLLIMKSAAKNAGELFEVNTDGLQDPKSLITEANQRLLQMAMQVHVQNNQLEIERKQIEEKNKQLEIKNQELKDKSDTDPLTGVYNRAYFDRELESAIENCRENAHQICLMFMDIDKFKSLNDNYGHMFGDQVLKSIAKVLKNNIRANDTLARYGGEEFVIIAKNMTIKGMDKFCERIRSCVESNKILFGEDEIIVTISIGATSLIPAREKNDEVNTLIQTADGLMYEAKKSGRNRFIAKSLLSEFENELQTLSTTSRFSRWMVSNNFAEMPQVTRALLQTQSPWRQIGALAIEYHFMSQIQLEKINSTQKTTNKRFGEIAVELGILSLSQLGFLVAIQQENPTALAETIASLGILKQSQLEEYLRQYFHEYTPKTNVSGAAG